MANDLTFGQLSTVLKAIVKQATGQEVITPTDTSSFITVGQTALKMGYDPLATAISQVLSRTIFSIRPYSRKFAGLQVTNQQYGNWTRKLNMVDSSVEDDQRFSLEQDGSVDMYKVNKPEVVQTNFYGAQQFQKHITIYRDQLDNAFQNPDEFASFLSMYMQNSNDVLEQCHETVARYVVANYVAGKTLSNDAGNSVIHLLTEYNSVTGSELTAQDIYKPENYKPFMQWVYSRIAALSAMLTERSTMFHTNLTDKPIPKHTPLNKQKVYLYAPIKFGTEAMVLADAFHDNYLRYAANETVNFWQSIKKPDEIQVKPTYLKEDGTLTTPVESVTVSNLFGVIFDEEAMGYTVVNQWAAPTPFNAAGGYYNQYYHFTDRYWNDFMENGIVLLLD